MENHERYRHLLRVNGITQAQSATLITAVTERPCAPRTVRFWLKDPGQPGVSKCPDWALAALEKAIRYMEDAIVRREQAQ